MLYPEQNEARLKLSMDGTWEFALGSCAENQFDPAKPLPDAQPIAVPASYNDQNDQTTALRRHYGWAWYQRKFTLPAFCAGQRVVLRFGSVTHTAKVWLNGQLIAQHKGGFTPFEADVTALLRPGETALLTVACDNRVNHSTLPVGNEDGQLAFFGSDNAGIPSVEAAKRAAAPQNRPNFDFFNYAGIHRPVVLYTTPKEYIEDVTVVPHTDGRVDYRIQTVGTAPVAVTVLEADGKAVASAEGAAGTLTIPEVQLWEPKPGTPYLYTLHITCGAVGTGAAAGVPARHVVAEQTAAGIADAHSAVDKGLDLQVRRGLVPDGADFLQTQLPGQDHPAGPQVVPGPGGLVVADAGLGGDVPLTPGGVLPRHGKGPQVRHDQGVHPGVRQPFQVLRQAGRLVVPGHGIDGAVDPDAVAVGKGHRLGQRLIGEVPRKGPHPKAGARQIHCVRAIEHGHFQPLHVPRRGQQLRLVPLNRHRSCC